MMWLIVTGVLLLAAAFEVRSGNIQAVGGGVVRPGQDLVLKYDAGSAWDRCFWYWYKHHSSYHYCSYDMSTNGVASKHKCKPAQPGKNLVYSGTSAKECSITVKNVTEADNCTWAVRLEEELMVQEIQVIVASPVQQVKVTLEVDIELDKVTKAECKVEGGRPAPEILFSVNDNASFHLMNYSIVQSQDANGIHMSEVVVFLIPQLSNHGLNVSCKAGIFDPEGNSVFDWVVSQNVSLNLKMPPTNNDTDIAVTGVVHDNVTLSTEFHANPAPTNVTWIVSTNDTSVIMNPGMTWDKYHALNVTSPAANSTLYRVSFNITNLEKSDEDANYSVIVANSLGQKHIHFELEVLNENETTTTSTTTMVPTTTVNSTTTAAPGIPRRTTAIIVVVLILIAIIGLGLLGYRVFWKRRHTQTAPLSSQEQR